MCNHMISNERYVVDVEYNEYTGDGIDNSHWDYITEYTYVDISLHQYKCTQCGKIFNYCGGKENK